MKKIYVQLVRSIWLALLAMGVMSSQVAWAQAIPDIQWTHTGTPLAITSDGNLVATEFISNQPVIPGSIAPAGDGLVKYALNGNQLWRTGLMQGGYYIGGKIPGYSYEVVGKVFRAAPTTDGGLAIVGKTSLRSASVAIKVSAQGGPRRWEDSDLFFDGQAELYQDDIIGTPDGGFLVLIAAAKYGSTTSTIVRKYDASGNFSWAKSVAYPTANPGNPDRSLTKGEAVLNAPGGGYLVVGYYNTTGAINDLANSSLTDNTGWVAKLTDQGDVVWQKLLSGLPVTSTNGGPVPGSIIKMYTASDVILSADGTGYALVGAAISPSSPNSPPPTTAILELDWNGNFKRARSLFTAPTEAFLTSYVGAGAANYYAVGNSSLNSGVDPQIVKVSTANLALSDPALFSVVSQRTFDSSTDMYLQGIDRAGDGSLVYWAGNQSVKLKVEMAPPGQPLTLNAPTYNCQTGAITFNVSGGNGSSITYIAPGVTRASATDNFGVVEPGLRNDPKVITITAQQSGVSVSYNFDLKAACSGTPAPKPPVSQPIPDQSLMVGQSWSGFPVGNYFSDPNLGMIPNYVPDWSFTITGLPDGLYVFSRPQDLLYTPAVTILGTPTTAGVYTVTVRASTGAFRNSPIVTTFKITVSPTNPPTGNPLVMSAPTYNCQTGAIVFNTSGGDGSPITYIAPGVTRASATDNFGTVEQGLRNDPKVITITAQQSGVSVSYNFDLKSACSNTGSPKPPMLNGPIPDQSLTVGQSLPGNGFIVGNYFSDPNLGVIPNYVPDWSFTITGLPDGLYVFSRPQDLLYTPAVTILGTPTTVGSYTVTVKASTAAFRNSPIITTFKITVSPTNPPTGALTLLAPVYDCATGAFTFRTSGGDGTPIEFQAAGITGWTTNPNQFVDKDSRTASDVKPFMLMARQSGQVVTYIWDLKAACGRARVGVEEPGTKLLVQVLGNPILGHDAQLDITGAAGQTLWLNLVDSQGRPVHQQTIDQAGSTEQIRIPVGQGSGLYLLQVQTARERQTVKLVRP
ncbi:T9SS type A sorting domain-containing protein [Spirosoma koreense]